jgi:hypothetical protein
MVSGRRSLLGSLADDDIPDLLNALLAVTFSDPDWEWVQDRCLEFLDHPDSRVKALAVTCLGHLARIHRKLDKERVVARLAAVRLRDPELAGRVEDATEDIEQYL